MFEQYDLDEMLNCIPPVPDKLKFVMLFALLKTRNNNQDFVEDLNAMLVPND